MKFNVYHLAVINHRLEVAEYGVFSDNLKQYQDQFIDIASKLKKRLPSMLRKQFGAFDDFTELERDIIQWCVSDSTFFSCIDERIEDGEITRAKAKKCKEAMRDLSLEFICDPCYV